MTLFYLLTSHYTACKFSYIQVYFTLHTHTYTSHTYTYAHLYLHTPIHSHLHAYTPTHTHRHTYIHSHSYILTHTHVHTYTYTHSYITHLHTCVICSEGKLWWNIYRLKHDGRLSTCHEGLEINTYLLGEEIHTAFQPRLLFRCYQKRLEGTQENLIT